jgi:alpha-tubulin suppressor-like RCC1 family protein
MAASEGVKKPLRKKLKEHYLFGFAKFFSFPNHQKSSGLTQGDQANAKGDDKMNYTTPVRVNVAPNFDKTCVTWLTSFHLSEDTGKVHVCGWCNGNKISANENVLLPIESKILDVQGGWKELILISDDGKCHVISNLHDDWTATVYESEAKFTTCDVGDMHTIVVDENGQAYELETDNQIQSLKTDNQIKSDSCLLSPLRLKVKVDLVSCGKEHVLLLNTTSGHVFSFGLGSRGQLGHGGVDAETTPKVIEALAGIRIKQVAAGGWHSLALSDIGDIYAWGWNNHGQLGITCLPPEVPQAFYMLPYITEFPQECMVDRIACGARHSAAVTSEPKCVWTWGWGQYGQLGHGDSLDRTAPTVVEYFQDTQILEITCGPWQTVVTLESIYEK